MELFKFLVFAGIIIGIMAGVGYLCRVVARRLHANPKVVTKLVMFVIFLICSYLWSFTHYYERLSKIIGISLEK